MCDSGRLVFIGGLHRSGTTPLARALASHPEISGLTGTGVSADEGQHLQEVYPRIRRYGGMGRFANAPAAHLTASSPLACSANADRLIRSWWPYWDHRKRLLLEKSPSNLIMTDFLQALFPGAGQIVVIRHPIAVALAMQKWNPRVIARNGRRRASLVGLVRHWLRAHELLRSDASRVQRLHVLRYEDLVQNPDRELAQIQQFLDLRTPVSGGELRRGMSDQYQQQWELMARSGPFDRRVHSAIEGNYSKAVAEYGYDLACVSGVRGPLDVVRLFGRRS